ncbi:Guanosine-5'-triphosphate,3'-diphosphate pyrophosphatase [Cronobacter universalis NCTC 9529]|nr:Guanosine-5'-triphosphate,3'-diphosphate pyrophosphatase [Cronobacter universalis NCTC 9529]
MLPDVTLTARDETLTATLPQDWFSIHPLGAEMLGQEQLWQSYVHWQLDVQ